MLGGQGVFRGSSVLVSGSAGTGKSSIAAKFMDAACRRGERRAAISPMRNSSAQIVRNMRSIGIDLEPWVKKGLLQIHASRPDAARAGAASGDDARCCTRFPARPWSLSIRSAISPSNADEPEVKPTLMRLIDFLKQQQITALFTSLNSGGGATLEDSQMGVSSLMDTWLMLRNVEFNGERNRTIYVLKSRGMAHSNQVREFVLSDKGIDLVDVYPGDDRVLTGTARVAQEAHERAAAEVRQQDHQRKLRHLAGKRKAIEAQIAALQVEAESEAAEVNFAIAQETLLEKTTLQNSKAMAHLRGGAAGSNGQAKG